MTGNSMRGQKTEKSFLYTSLKEESHLIIRTSRKERVLEFFNSNVNWT